MLNPVYLILMVWGVRMRVKSSVRMSNEMQLHRNTPKGTETAFHLALKWDKARPSYSKGRQKSLKTPKQLRETWRAWLIERHFAGRRGGNHRHSTKAAVKFLATKIKTKHQNQLIKRRFNDFSEVSKMKGKAEDKISSGYDFMLNRRELARMSASSRTTDHLLMAQSVVKC